MSVNVSRGVPDSRPPSKDFASTYLPGTDLDLAIRHAPIEQRDRKPTHSADRNAAPGVAQRTVALIDDHEFTRDCIATCLEMRCRDLTVVSFASLSDCIAAGSSGFELVIYHSRGGMAATGFLCAPLVALRQELGLTPIMIVSDVDDVRTVLEALTAGVRGYIPTVNTSLQVTVEVMHLLRAGGTFAPVATSMMQQARFQPGPAAIPSPDRFTPRQIAVLERLQHGSANKAIAYDLSMSEGTVKVHVRNIMRKLHATNRTQAVFRAYNLAAGAEPAGATARARAPA